MILKLLAIDGLAVYSTFSDINVTNQKPQFSWNSYECQKAWTSYRFVKFNWIDFKTKVAFMTTKRPLRRKIPSVLTRSTMLFLSFKKLCFSEKQKMIKSLPSD